jgi:hypothetical protein
MNFIDTIKNSNKFERLTYSSNDISDSMFGFTLKGKHVYYWFVEIGGEWYFNHSYSQNTGATKRTYKAMPQAVFEIYLDYSKETENKTATDGNNNMKNTILGAIECAKENGGVTYQLDNGILAGLPFYCISKSGYELRVDDLTEEVVKDYILQHAELLAQDGACLGMWKSDNGQFYLDVTDLWDKEEYTLEGALEIGRLRDQQAIFDLETMTEFTCHDFEVYIEDGRRSVIKANNEKAAAWFMNNGYSDWKPKEFGFTGTRAYEDYKDSNYFERVQMLDAGFTCLVR